MCFDILLFKFKQPGYLIGHKKSVGQFHQRDESFILKIYFFDWSDKIFIEAVISLGNGERFWIHKILMTNNRVPFVTK